MIIVELLLRMGLYDKFLKPASHMGNSMTRLRALNEFGINRVHWITVGDSRIDWGIDHKKLLETRKTQKVNHLRMSFGGANFMTIQAILKWSIDNMDALEGIVLGVSENKLTQKASFNKLYPKSWPFKKALDFENYHMMKSDSEILRYFYSLALVNYFQDIKNFIQNPIERFNKIKKVDGKNIERVFNYRLTQDNNICDYPLDTLEACINTAEKINHLKKIPDGFSLPVKLCDSFKARRRQKHNISVGPEADEKEIILSWQRLINHVLQREKRMVFVLLPDHEMYEYLLKPDNAKSITDEIIEKFHNHPNFILLDFRELIKGSKQCEYYFDPLHFNNKGINLITNKLIDSLMHF